METTLRKEVLRGIREDIRDRQKRIKEITGLPKLPKDIWEKVDSVNGNYGAIDIYLGWNPIIIKRVSDFMESTGWNQRYINDEKKGDTIITYSNPRGWKYPDIRFSFNTYYKGSTCKQVKIGTELVEKPIYEVVCNEGAEETW